MSETDDELKQWTYEQFCASEYHDLYIELFKRGWTETKLAAYPEFWSEKRLCVLA
jgi:hypothetical protein